MGKRRGDQATVDGHLQVVKVRTTAGEGVCVCVSVEKRGTGSGKCGVSRQIRGVDVGEDGSAGLGVFSPAKP